LYVPISAAVTLLYFCFQGDFCNTIDALSRIAVHSRQPPDGSVYLWYILLVQCHSEDYMSKTIQIMRLLWIQCQWNMKVRFMSSLSWL